MPYGHGGGRRYKLGNKIVSLFFAVNFSLLVLFFFSFSALPRSHKIGNYAFITLANNDNYAQGAIALAMSLLEVKSLYPLLVLVTEDVPRRTLAILENIGCIIYQIDIIELPAELSLQTARWGPAFTKLLAWQRTEFDKLIFMDSDLLVLKNVDSLFDQSNTLLATVDADASSCSFRADRLKLINSGVLVLTTSADTYVRLINTMHNKTLLASGVINDQDVIVHTMPWEGLAYPAYGAQVTHCECADSRMWDLDNTKIIHYTAGLRKLPKPWDYSEQIHEGIPPCVIHLFHLWKDLHTKALQLSESIERAEL